MNLKYFCRHIRLTLYHFLPLNRSNTSFSRFISFLLYFQSQTENISEDERGSWRGKIYKTEVVVGWIWSKLQSHSKLLFRAIFVSCSRQVVRLLLASGRLTSKARWTHSHTTGVDKLLIRITAAIQVTCVHTRNETYHTQEGLQNTDNRKAGRASTSLRLYLGIAVRTLLLRATLSDLDHCFDLKIGTINSTTDSVLTPWIF